MLSVFYPNKDVAILKENAESIWLHPNAGTAVTNITVYS